MRCNGVQAYTPRKVDIAQSARSESSADARDRMGQHDQQFAVHDSLADGFFCSNADDGLLVVHHKKDEWYIRRLRGI